VYVILDAAGHDHSLARRAGVKAKELREFLHDVALDDLPSVDEARAQHRSRRQEQARERSDGGGYEAAQQPEYFDRDAQDRAWQDGIVQAALDHAEEQERAAAWQKMITPRTRQEPEPERKPIPAPELGRTSGEIRLASRLTASGQAFADALEDRGLILARVTAEDMQNLPPSPNPRRATESEQQPHRQPRSGGTLREGELVVVNQYGSMTRLSYNNTGLTRAERDARFQDIDRDALLSVTDAREVMAEVQAHRREEWKQERRAPYLEKRRAQLAGNADAQAINSAYRETRTGEEWLSALQERGFVVGRVTEEDAARSQNDRALGIRAARVEAGQYVALNEHGRVFHLDGTTIDDREQRILTRLADADASKHLTFREAKAAVEQERLADRMDAARTPRAKPGDPRSVMETIQPVALAGNMLGGAVKVVIEPLLGALSDFFTGGSAPPTPPPARAPQPPPSHAAPTPPERIRERINRATPEVAAFDPDIRERARHELPGMPQALQEELRRRAAEIEERRRERERERGRER
jgi:hypothetical protein